MVLDSLQGLDNLDHFHNKVYKALAQKGLVKELGLVQVQVEVQVQVDIYRILPDKTVQLDHNYLQSDLYNPVLLEQVLPLVEVLEVEQVQDVVQVVELVVGLVVELVEVEELEVERLEEDQEEQH